MLDFFAVEHCIQLMAKFRDAFGLITQPDRDGGDSCNRVAMYYGCLNILNVTEDDLNRHPLDGFYITTTRLTANLPEGRYRRHPDSTKWYSNPDDVTRDQMAPLIAAMVLYGTNVVLFKHLRLRVKRSTVAFLDKRFQ
jgi:hypothetical protein